MTSHQFHDLTELVLLWLSRGTSSLKKPGGNDSIYIPEISIHAIAPTYLRELSEVPREIPKLQNGISMILQRRYIGELYVRGLWFCQGLYPAKTSRRILRTIQ
jgi:hypothetical protein